jgi:hypothetical protein
MRLSRINFWRHVFALGLLLSTALGRVHAQSTSASAPAFFSANAVKAAYLVNFIRFTDWPDEADEFSEIPFVIGVVGNREIEDQLLALTDGKRLNNRRVRVQRLTQLKDADACQLIYIDPLSTRPESVGISSAEWLTRVRGRSVLTVAHEAQFLRKGGMINFYAEDQNLRFEIAPHAASLVKLEVSSRLLAIARISRAGPDAPANPAP